MSYRPGRKIWIATATILFLAACVYISNSLTELPLDVPVLDGSTTTVIPGVHLIGSIGPAAAYVVETSDGLALIDSGLDDDAGAIKSEMEKLGLDWKRLRAIFLTHVHGDHCGGAERLRAETGATVYAGQRDASIIAAGGPRDAFFSTFQMPNHSPHPTRVDLNLEGGEVISIGNATFKILDTPGHTSGSVCYLLEKNGRRVLFSGDVIFRLGNKPLGTYSAYMAPRYRGDAREYLSTLKTLRHLRVPDLVLPGHPAASRPAHSPKLSPPEWDEMLDSGIHEMERLVARFDSDGADFLDGEPKQLLPGLYYFGDFMETAVYGLAVGSEFILIDAHGGTGLYEYLQRTGKELGLQAVKPTAVLLTACSARETAGLSDLIEQTHAQVFVAEAGMELIRARCPSGTTIVATNEPDKLKQFSVTPIELGMPGTTLLAYALDLSHKKILISGNIPTGGNQRTIEELVSPPGKASVTLPEFIGVIRSLSTIRPDLWLPARPVNSQNANLYQGEWQAILEKDFKAARELVQFRGTP